MLAGIQVSGQLRELDKQTEIPICGSKLFRAAVARTA
jgi:hypothetical protein